MIADGGDGLPNGDGAYRKASSGSAPHEGAVYAVAGSASRIGGGAHDHPAMFTSLHRLGSLVLDVDGEVLDGLFLDSTGAVGDRFTLIKGNGAVVFVDGFEAGSPAAWSGGS